MSNAIFLSASVPDPKRAAEFARTADAVAISAAVTALVHVTLGRRRLVWGGHPAITPMLWVVAQDIGVEYGSWVTLYQSRYFQDEFPEDNERFQNVRYIDSVENDREKSLRLMRMRMLTDVQFGAGVFIGGMSGIVDEFKLFRDLQPGAGLVPVLSTGGAVLEAAKLLDHWTPDLRSELDYVALFHRHLGISARERRYLTPDDQPNSVEDRYWEPGRAAPNGGIARDKMGNHGV